MKYAISIVLLSSFAILAGCADQDARTKEKDADPTFMFWCFRKEIVSEEFRIPEMRTAAAASYLQNRAKAIPGYVDSRCNLNKGVMTIDYASSTVRKMNFEEAIALAGFNVNYRPANPNAKIPAGVK